MTNIKDLIKSFTKEDYEQNRVNLHIHSSYSDGRGDFSDLVKQSKEKNYKYISITDHNTVAGYIDNPDCEIITGVEFDVWYKYIFLHLLAYGIDVNAECMKKFYAMHKSGTEKDIVRILPVRNIYELIKSVHEAGGIAVIAHPACCWALDMDKFIKDLKEIGLDGVEVYYPYPRWRRYMKFAPVEKIEEIADKYDLIKTGGTDCHSDII